jgi:hypothetical protein
MTEPNRDVVNPDDEVHQDREELKPTTLRHG